MLDNAAKDTINSANIGREMRKKSDLCEITNGRSLKLTKKEGSIYVWKLDDLLDIIRQAFVLIQRYFSCTIASKINVTPKGCLLAYFEATPDLTVANLLAHKNISQI